MAQAPNARCVETYCNGLQYKKGRCVDHYIPWAQPSKRDLSASDAELKRWGREIRKRDPVCRACGTAHTKEADHIIPVANGGAPLDLANGQGLCRPCHALKTKAEAKARLKPNRRKEVW